MSYETVIGLEVHVQLNTESKMFCGCSTKFGGLPNSQTCPVCLGFPGSLPVINKKALFLGVKTALALNCKIADFTKFDRKHYYYPDLPKNFQISQYDKPFSHDGFLEIVSGGKTKTIALKRIHMEEDAGKLIHQQDNACSLVDYNRAGTPLMEIVTQPDLNSPEEAYEFLVKLKMILEYLEVSDCNMEEGSLRCDANISLRPAGQTALGIKTEVKNMNSFKGVRQALEYEVTRQADILTGGGKVVQDTRLWDSERQRTNSMRTKEDAHDYRYFPEPDLMPIIFDARIVEDIKKSLPEMPEQKQERFVKTYGLSEYDSSVLTRRKRLADLFEETLKTCNRPKIVANWISSDLLGVLNEKGIELGKSLFTGRAMADLLNAVESGAISSKMGKDLLRDSIETGKGPLDLIKEKGLAQITDEKIIADSIDKVINNNPKAVEDYKGGKEASLTFLVGQIMRETKGKANPKLVNEILRKRL